MKIIRAEKMGFCFGVKEAVKLVGEITSKDFNAKKYMLGMLVHNREVIKEIEENGIEIIDKKDLGRVSKDDIVIIRAHGTTKDIYNKLKSINCIVYDAACIFVKKAREVLEKKEKIGFEIIYIGDKNHPEVVGIISYGEKVKVISDYENFKQYVEDKKERKFFILAQTTLNKNEFKKIEDYTKVELKNSEVGNTICGATFERQKSVEKLAKNVEIVLVVGGRNSSNTKKLYNISKKLNDNTHFIESADELDFDILKGYNLIGITAGASTPEKSVKEIEDRISKKFKNKGGGGSW